MCSFYVIIVLCKEHKMMEKYILVLKGFTIHILIHNVPDTFLGIIKLKARHENEPS
jgi:hypothetical protein